MSHHDADPEVINAGNRPELGFEYRDVDQYFGLILKVTFWFMVFTTISIIVTVPIMNAIARKPLLDMKTPIRGGYRPNLPAEPNPILQSDQTALRDIHKLRSEEEAQASGYGWVDEKKGVARIPVDEALQEVAREGLAPEAPGGTGDR